jgi:hypothetical protein
MTDVDWARYNLPAIWSLISDVDVCTGSDRVLAWDGLATTMRDQHQRLLTAADGLAAVWPPEKNDSARFFLQQVSGLADSMQETLQKAEDTRAGLQGVIEAFSTAQTKVRDLASGRQGVSNDWMPRFIDHAEDKYDEHAQAAMREAESAIQDHGSQIQAPSLFQMGEQIDGGGHHLTDGSGQTAGSSPSESGRRGLRATPRPVPVHSDPSGVFPDSPANFGSDAAGSGSSDGPVLSGVTPTIPGSGGLPGAPIGGGPGAGLGLPPNGSLGGGTAPLGVLPFGTGDGFVGGLPGRAGSGARRPVSVRRAMPSGAVIGEVDRSGGATRGAASSVMPMGASGGRGADRRNKDGAVGGQADHQWETHHGVAPVIGPATAEARHDPGPGVIGLDR